MEQTEPTPTPTPTPAPAPAPAPAAVPTRPAGQRVLDRMGTLVTLLIERPVSLYAAAVLRIGYGLLYLVFLLREFPHRDEIWGPGSPWTPALARQLFGQTEWASILTLSDGRAYFEACYAAAVVTSALFMVGWRTRAVSVLFAIVVASFHARAVFMTDGGDNLFLLMAVYLVFTACGRRWSLDARRKASPAGDGSRHRRRFREVGEFRGVGEFPGVGEFREFRDTASTVLHNCGMFVIAAQVCFLYGSAGLYKVQGGSWGNGTALHYVLNLDLFRPWPALSLLLDEHPVAVAVAGYLTVLLQVAFPFVLFGRLKYPVLVMLVSLHLGIAVLLGLPVFSGVMVVADAVFLPDRFYRSLRSLWSLSPLSSRPPRSGRARAPVPGEPALVPAQPGPAGPAGPVSPTVEAVSRPSAR